MKEKAALATRCRVAFLLGVPDLIGDPEREDLIWIEGASSESSASESSVENLLRQN